MIIRCIARMPLGATPSIRLRAKMDVRSNRVLVYYVVFVRDRIYPWRCGGLKKNCVRQQNPLGARSQTQRKRLAPGTRWCRQALPALDAAIPPSTRCWRQAWPAVVAAARRPPSANHVAVYESRNANGSRTSRTPGEHMKSYQRGHQFDGEYETLCERTVFYALARY